MNRKQTIILISATAILVLGVVGFLLYTGRVPILQTIGIFPGEGQPVPPKPGEEEEEVNIPIFIPGVNNGASFPQLYELHKVPVAGVGLVETDANVSSSGASKTKKAGATSSVPRAIAVRYLERGLGHIYETSLATLIETRIVNETRPRIIEAFFGNKGNSVAVRSLEEKDESEFIKTRILNMGASASSTAFFKTEEVTLPDHIPFMAAAEDGANAFFYLTSGLTSAAGSLITSKGAHTGIFSSSFTEWLPQFPNQNLVTITTRPSSSVPGYLFFLNTKTKALTKILDGVNGLTTKTNRSGTLVLYSQTGSEGTPELFVYDMAQRESRLLTLKTLPEKCAWSVKEAAVAYCAVPQTLPSAVYPDQWYRGTVSFSDSVWKIDTVAGRVEKIFTPAALRAPELDIINPVLSSDDSSLVFMNKISGTPWVYRIVMPPPQAVAATTTLPVTTIAPSSDIGTEGMVKIK